MQNELIKTLFPDTYVKSSDHRNYVGNFRSAVGSYMLFTAIRSTNKRNELLPVDYEFR